MIEVLVERVQAERRPRNQVPVERLQMPQVEDDPMPFGDRAIVHGLGLQQLEQVVGLNAGFP